MDSEDNPSPVALAPAPAAREAIDVLIIDDEPHVRAFLRAALRSLGVAAIHEAANGEEGVARFAALRPALVLLDLHMPVMSGAEALGRLRAIDPDAAVVVVTTDCQHETVKRIRALGAMGYVLKHRPPAELRAGLAETLACFVVE
jgi:two-component system chemotaxis response regulator CheY